MGKIATGLVEDFRVAIDLRRYGPELASLTAVHAEQQQLLRWDLVSFDALFFRPISHRHHQQQGLLT
eukprot:3439561-Pleurochrysis_carterae.AAC.1